MLPGKRSRFLCQHVATLKERNRLEIRSEMNVPRSPSSTLFGPALLCGAAGGLLAYVLLHDTMAAALVVTASLGGAFLSMLSVKTQQRRAAAKLKQSATHTGDLEDCGVFAEVVKAASGRLRTLRDQVDEASRLRAELEARNHVRRKQALQFERAFSSLDQGVLITDPQGQLRFHNSAADELFRLAGPETQSASQPTGDSDRLLSTIPTLAALLEEARLRSAATDRRTAEFTIGNEPSELCYRATATNLTDDDGSLLGTVTLFTEIGDERREKNRHAEFVSAVSHEFKTPMASIKAFTELLVDGDVTSEMERQEVYGFIETQIDRLTRMVDNMLNLTRVESGVIQVHREDCELNDVLQKSLNVVRPAAEDKQIRICSELSDLYLAAYIDRDLLGQAIINLISNAVKYTPDGGEVRLKSRMDESEAIIEVSDTGMGIPEESLPHIFDRFYRVPENNKAAAGTGLGLSLVHYIVTELHNGRISVQSKVGDGTTVKIALPLGHQRQSRTEPERTLVRN